MTDQRGAILPAPIWQNQNSHQHVQYSQDRECTLNPPGTPLGPKDEDGHNPYNGLPCETKCDFKHFFNIDYGKKEAFLKDTLEKGPDGTKSAAIWYRLKLCAKRGGGMPEKDRGAWEIKRSSTMGDRMADDILGLYSDLFKKPEYSLRARMTWFFLNFYATPKSIVGSFLPIYKQFHKVWTHSLGNYRQLAYEMFNDDALRKSLDQLQEVPCGFAPIENFGREWFERFTVGLTGHNEGDVKILAKALQNCYNHTAKIINEDHSTPGIIFTDPNEQLWSITSADRKAIVDRILDFRRKNSEPPVAAQFLCHKLYGEFGRAPGVSNPWYASSVGYAPDVVRCAEHLFDHHYDIKFALEYILQDKEYFQSTLGTKKRWPYAVIFGMTQEHGLDPGIDTLDSILTRVGMKQFEPQDVSGWSLDDVWTIGRLASMHKILMEHTYIDKWFEGADFKNATKFLARFDGNSVVSSPPSPADPQGLRSPVNWRMPLNNKVFPPLVSSDRFSFSRVNCESSYVKESDKDTEISISWYFESNDKAVKNFNRRYCLYNVLTPLVVFVILDLRCVVRCCVFGRGPRRPPWPLHVWEVANPFAV